VADEEFAQLVQSYSAGRLSRRRFLEGAAAAGVTASAAFAIATATSPSAAAGGAPDDCYGEPYGDPYGGPYGDPYGDCDDDKRDHDLFDWLLERRRRRTERSRSFIDFIIDWFRSLRGFR
jgi:hypothetical protein